ncbi:hypothetical protein ACQ4PT_011640 [Festuca glaucescens]
MDKSRMTAPRSTTQYAQGVSFFLEFATEKAGMRQRFLCPCTTCANRYWLSESEVRDHLVCNGFMAGYNIWLFHGEDLEVPATDCSSDDEEYADSDQMDNMLLEGFGMYDTSTLGEDDDEKVDSEDDADLYFDVEAYNKLVLDGSKELFPGCKKLTKLQFLVKLMNIKNMYGVPNACFDDTLSLFKAAIPDGDSLPKNFHACKKYIKDVGLGYESIDSCKHDCIMFRGEHSEATVCPVCNTSRWRSVNKGADGKREYKVAHKVIRHFPLKHRVRRLFMCSETSANISWHRTGRTKDSFMRHPADSPAWKAFDEEHPWFREDARYLRFGLATDGFNPFKHMNVSYSIWPIILIPYNLPPWIFMKQSNFIMNVLVPGRKSPGKEMDIYMQLTIDDLQEFWKPGVLVYDAVAGKIERIHAALLWTISDWLGRGCISGESLAVCSHCLTNTCSRWLKYGHKTCFLGHRRFLNEHHVYRLDEVSFNGKAEFKEAPTQPTGIEISQLTEALYTDYGKLQKTKNKKKRKKTEDEECEDIYCHTIESTFKKRSVFFQLPYWKTLLIRNNLDIMHIEKNVFDNIVNTVLDVDKRSKDNLNARKDLQVMNIRSDLHADFTGPKPVIPKAIYHMNAVGKKYFLKVLKHEVFPDGYASSLFPKVQKMKKQGSTVSIESQQKKLEKLNHQLHKMDLPSADMPIDDDTTRLYLLQNAKKRGMYYSQLEAARNYDTEEEEEDAKEDDAEFDDDKTGQGEYEEEQYAQEQYEEEEEDAPVQSMPEEAKQKINETPGKKKEGVRGPTEMKKFWEKHGPDNKVELVFNHLGQPCGVKTSKLANFIGSCVKGKEVSMGHDEWRKVPQIEKDRLWKVVKGFFNIGDEHQDWVMKSASKKWRTFRAHLKETYFDDELSLRQNIINGCDELKKKRLVSRAELYAIVHTNSKGQLVDTYSSKNIASIKEKLGKNPELIREAHQQGDLYSKIFPETRKSRMHGLGLMVGGKTSQILDQAIVAVKDSKDENKELREMIRTMAESHKALVIRSQAMEEKIEGLILSQQQVHKVKLEKVKENSAARLKCKLHKENEIHALKRGMEVSLRSPNSLQLVALATLSNVDDKETGPDYVEMNVVTQSEIVHQKIWKEHDEERSRVEKDGVSAVVEKTKKIKRGSTDVSVTKQYMSQNEGAEADGQKRRKLLNKLDE